MFCKIKRHSNASQEEKINEIKSLLHSDAITGSVIF